MKNNYANYSSWSLAFLFLLFALLGEWVAMFLAPLGLIPFGLAIKALLNYRKNNSIGGKGLAIAVIVLSIFFIALMIVFELMLRDSISNAINLYP